MVFRVRFASLASNNVFNGRADEDEYLIEGRVDEVEVSAGEAEDDDAFNAW